MAATRATGGLAALAGDRNFQLLWMGQATSDFGSALTELALPLLLLGIGYTATTAGVVATVIVAVGTLGQLPMGYLADRFDRRRIMLACDALRLVVLLVITLGALAGTLPLWLVFLTVVLAHLAWAAFGPAQAKLLRDIVPRSTLTHAVAVNQARAYAAGLVAPAVSGLLLTVGRALPFAVDTVTFGVSAVCIVALRVRRAVPVAVREKFLPAVGAGWTHLRRDPFLTRSTLYCALLNLAFAQVNFVVVLGLGRRHDGPLTAGLAVALAGVLGVAGSLVAPRTQRALPLPVVLAAGPLGCALALVGAAFGATTAGLIAGFALLAFGCPVANTALSAVRMLVVPDAVYGRVLSTSAFAASALQPFAPLTAGLLVSLLPLPGVPVVIAVELAAVIAVAATVPTPAAARPQPREVPA
jgi:MFS family permease